MEEYKIMCEICNKEDIQSGHVDSGFIHYSECYEDANINEEKEIAKDAVCVERP